MRQAAEALSRGEFSVTHDLAKRVTEGAPAFEDGWMMLTEALAESERYEEGLSTLDEAMSLHPQSLPLQIQRCKFLLGLSRRAECLEQARVLADKVGQDTWAMDMLAMYFSLLDQVDESSSLYEQLCQLEPDNPNNHVNLGMTKMAQGRFEEARACAERALSIAPEYPRALSLLSSMETATEDDNRVDRLTSALQTSRPLPERVSLGYALGNYLALVAAQLCYWVGGV